jgi:CheY-like chemotaxis protein
VSTDQVTSILVVEDDPLSAELITELLRANGFTVRLETSGEDGLRAAYADVPTLVLLDLGLPGIDGFETMRALRTKPSTSSIAIVAVTAQAMAGDAERAIAAGFDDYLTKPIDTRALVPRITSLLSRLRG